MSFRTAAVHSKCALAFVSSWERFVRRALSEDEIDIALELEKRMKREAVMRRDFDKPILESLRLRSEEEESTDEE